MTRRRFVDQSYPVGPVHDDDAFTKILDDVVVQLGEISKVDTPLLGERLRFADAARDRVGCERDREQDGAEHACRDVVGTGRYALQLAEALFAEYRQCRDRRSQRAGAARQQQTACADRDYQQAAEPASDAAACMHHRHDHRDIDGKLQRQLSQQARPAVCNGERVQRAEYQQRQRRRHEQRRVLCTDNLRQIGKYMQAEQK